MIVNNEREKTIYQQGYMSGCNAAQTAIKAAEHRAEVAEKALYYVVREYRCEECPYQECNAEECCDTIANRYKERAAKDIAEEEKMRRKDAK